MSKKANQHFVPQFYFRFFSRDGRSICVLNLRDGSSCPTASIKGQASRNKFYGSTELEDAFAEMEGKFSSPLRRLIDGANLDELTDAESLLILQAVMFQRSRTLAARNSAQPMNNRLMQLFLEVSINSDPDLPDAERQELISGLENLEVDPLRFHLDQIKTSIENAHLLGDLIPVILENRTNRPFIFGDSPVVFHNAHCGKVKLRGVLGFSTPGLQVIFPLSEGRILLLLDENTYRIRGLRSKNIIHIRQLSDVSMLNRLQLHSASNSVYFSEYKCDEYVRTLWRQERISITDNLVNVVEAPGVDEEGNQEGELLHTFAPLLPIELRLSFLSHAIIDDKSYKFERRGAYG